MKKQKNIKTLIFSVVAASSVIAAIPMLSSSCKKENLDEVASKIEPKISDEYKNSHTAEEFEKELKPENIISLLNIDKSKYETTITKVKKTGEDTVEISVEIKSKKTKKAIIKKFAISGFKKVESEEQKKLNALVNKINSIDYEGKEDTLAKDAKDPSKIKWEFKSGVAEKKEDYEITKVEFLLVDTDATKLKIKFYLKNKKTNLESTRYFQRTLEGFKKPEITDPEEKKFNYYVNGLVAKYSETTDNLDLDELVLDKIKYFDSENKPVDVSYTISEVKWSKETINKIEWGEGKRKFKAKFSKGKFTLIREFEIQTHVSDKDVLIDQRKKFKENTRLIQEPDIKQLVEKMENEAELYYSYKDYKFYNKKYDKDNPDDPERKAIFELVSYSGTYGTNFKYAKLIKNGDKYSLKFKLSKYVGQGVPDIDDIKEFQTAEEKFDVYDQNKLDELADQNKDKFDYKNKENTKLVDVIEQNIIKPEVSRCGIQIVKIEKILKDNELIVTYKLTYKSMVSKEVKATIKGFKEDNLNSYLNDVSLDYEGKDTKSTTEASLDSFKFYKEGNEYNLPADITVKKEIISSNEYKGIIKIKVTLEKEGMLTHREYLVSGFKKSVFNLDDFNDKLNFKYQGNISETVASSVQFDQFKIENSKYPLDSAEITKVELIKSVEEGKVTIKYTLKDLCNDGLPEKEFSKTIEGFKKSVKKLYRSPEVYEASVQGKLFTIDTSKLDKLREFLEKQTTLVALKNGFVWTKNNKGKRIEGLSVLKQAITHGSNVETVARVIAKGNSKGINIVKEGNNWVAKWKLILKNGKIDDQVFSQVLCSVK